MNNLKNLFWGLVLIIIGVIWGLNATGVADINIFFNGWWTLFIIIPCFCGLFTEKDRTGNIIGLIFGISLLLACNDVMNFDIVWKLLFPTILVVVGLSFIFKDFFDKKINDSIKKINEKNKNKEEYCATFSEQKLNFSNQEFNGTSLNAIFGSIRCDLRDAKIDNDVVINTTSVFGGIDILVPNDVNVKVKSSCIFGSVDDKRKNKSNDSKHTIYINSNCIFGGVDIK